MFSRAFRRYVDVCPPLPSIHLPLKRAPYSLSRRYHDTTIEAAATATPHLFTPMFLFHAIHLSANDGAKQAYGF